VLFDVVRAEDFCHRLKDDIGAYDWWRLAPGLRVTCTLGYARLRSGEDPTQFIIRSIYGLLDGKKGGGNVVNEGPRFLPTTSPQPLPSSFQRVEYHTPFGMAAGREFKPFSLRDYFS
jgi:hypothetical protein